MNTSSSPTLTVAQLIALGESLFDNDSARLDAELIITHVLHKDRAYLRTWPDRKPSETEQSQIQALFSKRTKGEPIAYLIGTQAFWSRNFKVTPDTLIPRADTETLIEAVLDLEIKASITESTHKSKPITVIDLGTGSGIIAITIKLERPEWDVSALEASNGAIKVAAQNAKDLGADVHFIHQDWVNWNKTENKSMTFDLIVSNPPYIEENDIHLNQGDVRFEPRQALVAGDNGLKAFKEIIQLARSRLNPGGYLVFEHGYKQAQSLSALLKSFNFKLIKQLKDLSGNDRVTIATGP